MSSINEEIINELKNICDPKYRDFQAKLIPNVDKESVIGVRTPALRKYAKQLVNREDIVLQDKEYSLTNEMMKRFKEKDMEF